MFDKVRLPAPLPSPASAARLAADTSQRTGSADLELSVIVFESVRRKSNRSKVTAVASMASAGAEPMAEMGKSTGCGLSETVQTICSSKSPLQSG